MTVDAMQLLRDAVGRSSISHVARELRVSRPAVSLLLAGKYKGSADRMLARVVARFGDGHVHCPYLAAPIAVPDCRALRTRPMPTSSPELLRHWTHCRTCPVGGGLAALAKQGVPLDRPQPTTQPKEPPR